MAIRKSIGGTGLDWNSTVTWGGDDAPTTGDGVLLGPGRHGFTDGLNQSAVALNRLIIDPLAVITFGDTLQIDVDNGTDPFIDHAGEGVLPLSGDVTTAFCRRAAILRAIGGTWAEAFVEGGNAFFGSACALTALFAQGGRANVTSHASSRIATFRQNAGVVSARRSIEDGLQSGGLTRLEGAASIFDDGSPDTAVYVLDGPQAVLDWAGSAATGGTLHALQGEVKLDEHYGDIALENYYRGRRARFPITFRHGAVSANTTGRDYGINEPRN